MRTIIITPAIFLSASILAGCAATEAPAKPGTDELAGEGNDGEQPKADAAHDSFGFVAIEKSGAFQCNNPLSCLNYQLTRPNRSTIKCNDDQYHESCAVHAVEWTLKGLSQSQADQIEAALEREAQDPSLGVQVLAKGDFQIAVDFLTFIPTEVWLAQKVDGNTNGTFVRMFDRGIECVTAPCPVDEEDRLNSSRTMNIDGIDFGNTSGSLQDKVNTALTSPDGVILAGERMDRSEVSFTTELRSADQVFLRLQ
jgi:hypothetical protein